MCFRSHRRYPSPFIGLAVALLLAAPAFAGDDPWLHQAKLIAADGAEFDNFGASVALEGDTAVVGATAVSVDGNASQGAVYVLTYDGEAWGDAVKLTALDGAANDLFGSRVAISGDTIVVGVSSANVDGNSNQGAAYVFAWDGAAWVEEAKLIAGDGAANDEFGRAVALFGDTALVGAWRANLDDNSSVGAAYVFVREDGLWTQQAKLLPDDLPLPCTGLFCPRIGSAVALWGDTALVGAQHLEVDSLNHAGGAYVFVRDEGEWTEQATLTRAGGEASDLFGSAVALRGDTAVVGAPQANIDANTNQGAAHVYTRDGGAWTEQQVLTAADGTTNDRFGAPVALGDDLVLVGVQQVDVDGNTRQGAAYAFARSGSTWTGQQQLTAPDGAGDDRFGVSVALADGVALVGANRAMIDGNARQGAAYVFVAQPAGDPPALAFSPPSLDFGQVEVGATSEPLDATLSNTGDDDATGLEFSTPGSGFSVVANDCGSELPAGDDCQLSLAFSPAAAGPAGDTLTVQADNDIDANLNLLGSGQPPPQPGELSVTPATLDFGPVPVGSIETDHVTVSNVADPGAETLELSAIDLAGDAEFGLAGGSCSVGTQLAPGNDCTVAMDFSPDEEGDFGATLQIDTGQGQAAQVNLTGAGVELTESPDWLLQAALLEPGGSSFVSPAFGWSAALDGNTALVGRLDNSGSPISESRAYVFVRDGESWGEPAVLRPAEHPVVCPPRGQSSSLRRCPHLGFAVAVSGDVAVIGQPWGTVPGAPPAQRDPNQPQGAAYVFVRQGDEWVEQAKLMAADGEPHDYFGFSVAVSGDTVVVGAPDLLAERPGLPLESHGAVYVFERQGDQWTEQARLDPEDFPLMCSRPLGQPVAGCPSYGHSVDIDGDIVLVGAPGAQIDRDDSGTDVDNWHHGLVYAFAREGGAWSQQARLVASDGAGHHRFGISLALDGTTALVGAGHNGIASARAAYVFERDGDTWIERQKLTASDDDGTDWRTFGNQVALSGDDALVAAPRLEVDGEPLQGMVYRFAREGGSWFERQKLTVPPATDCSPQGGTPRCYFGTSVAQSAGTALIGAVGVGQAQQGAAGAAFVFTDTDAALAFEPAGLNFGQIKVGESGVPLVAVILRNRGENDLSGLSFIPPAGDTGFDADTGACGPTLAVDESCEVSVTFTPAAHGPASAWLQVESDQGLSASLSLTGIGIPDEPQGKEIFRDRFEGAP